MQRSVVNTEEGSNPGAPLAWGSPENPDDAVAGYGYVAADTSEVEETFYYHSDHLGSTAYITDQKANVTQYDAYLPYGELLVDEHSSSADLPYRFNGKELDEETGLYYYGARYMNPITSMWYGVDPLAEKYDNIGGYVYCAGNPVVLVDPDGKIIDTIWDIGNVIYDAGAAIYHHAKGNHNAAKENWKDAGADVIAMIIPGVPAGATKVYKAGKKAVKAAKTAKTAKTGTTTSKFVNKSTQSSKTAKVDKFRQKMKEGKEHEQSVINNLRDEGSDVVTQKRLVPQNGVGNVVGNRTNVDGLVKNSDGTYSIVETKLSDAANLSPGQQAAQEHILNGSGLFEVRSNIPEFGLQSGSRIKVKEYKVVYKYKTKGN